MMEATILDENQKLKQSDQLKQAHNQVGRV